MQTLILGIIINKQVINRIRRHRDDRNGIRKGFVPSSKMSPKQTGTETHLKFLKQNSEKYEYKYINLYQI